MTTAATATTTLTPKRFYRVVAVGEAITWTLLIVGLLLKYALMPGELGDLAVRISGSIHGFVFIAYAATAVVVGLNQRWGTAPIAFGVATAVVPYATIPFDRWLERRGRLEGGWRTQSTDDLRDTAPIDRLLRWFLARPVVLGLLLVAGVVMVFAALLVAGPPGGR